MTSKPPVKNILKGIHESDINLTKKYEKNLDLVTKFKNSTETIVIIKDCDSRFIDCNDLWLRYANMKNKDEMFGLTDRDVVWSPFADIQEKYEMDVLQGHAYPLLNPGLVENNRFCWIQNFKWPLYDSNKNIIGINVIAIEVKDAALSSSINIFTNMNRFGIKTYSIDKPIKDDLNNCEKEILFYICYGLTAKQIGKVVNKSNRTIEKYIENIKVKLNCDNKFQIIEYAVSAGYVSILPRHLLMKDCLNKIADTL